MADLDHVLAGGLLVGGAHPLGVLHRERHGLFLVDVLAGLRCAATKCSQMQMLRRGDQHRVDGLVVQQAAVIQVGLGAGGDVLSLFQTLGVYVGRANALHILQRNGLAENFLPPAPGPIMPSRTRWFAPMALDAAKVPARPVATLLIKLRRDSMEMMLLVVVQARLGGQNDYNARSCRRGQFRGCGA